MRKYALGLDFGTNSVRALLVDVANGEEISTSIHEYATGQDGIILDPSDPHLARQHPQDYLDGLEVCVRDAISEAKKTETDFGTDQVIGIGIDTTGSTPLPVDREGTPLCFKKNFRDNPKLGCGRTTQARPSRPRSRNRLPKNTRNTWLSAGAPILRSGFSAKSSTA
jgi:L-ribulokinase